MVRCSPDPDEGAADSVELAGSAPRDEATTADVDAAPCSTLPLDCDTCAQASAVSGSKTSAVKSGRTNATSFTGCRPFRQVASRSYDAPPEAVSREARDGPGRIESAARCILRVSDTGNPPCYHATSCVSGGFRDTDLAPRAEYSGPSDCMSRGACPAGPAGTSPSETSWQSRTSSARRSLLSSVSRPSPRPALPAPTKTST